MKIIAIGAHLDDIELACGGVLAKAIKHNHKVKMIAMTDSAYTDCYGNVLRTKNDSLKEGRLAAKKLGVEDLVVFSFKTRDLPYNSRSIVALDKEISLFKPDYIFTHWIFDTHQDHRNAALATISAARYYNNILMYEPFPPSGRSYFPFRPQVYIDVSDSIETKILAMKQHKSQYSKYGEDWVEAIKGRARMRGFECACKYAEVFELVRSELKI
jgi:LmbE family N-acetylglucosaminyl deacetylase